MSVLPWAIPNMPKEEGERRHKAIREAMEFRGIDCLVIAGHVGNYGGRRSNFRYVTNYAMWFDDEYIVFPLEKDPFLIAFNTAHYVWAKRICWIEVRVRGVSGVRNYVADIVNGIKDAGNEKGTIGLVNMETMPAYIYAGLLKNLPNATFVSAGDLINQIRMIKSPIELEFMRKSALCADKGFEAIKATARPGVQDRAVWTAMDSAMTMVGAEPPTFTLYASGPYEKKGINYPYGPMDRVLKKGDMVLSEIGPSYGGYWTQLVRPLSLGKPGDTFKRAMEIQTEMYNMAVEMMRPGTVLADIDAKVREMAKKAGHHPLNAFTMQHTGLDNLDRIPKRTVLRPGMTFVNHPWTEFPPDNPTFGGHTCGDTYIVTEGKPECLSKLPFEISIV